MLILELFIFFVFNVIYINKNIHLKNNGMYHRAKYAGLNCFTLLF